MVTLNKWFSKKILVLLELSFIYVWDKIRVKKGDKNNKINLSRDCLLCRLRNVESEILSKQKNLKKFNLI